MVVGHAAGCGLRCLYPHTAVSSVIMLNRVVADPESTTRWCLPGAPINAHATALGGMKLSASREDQQSDSPAPGTRNQRKSPKRSHDPISRGQPTSQWDPTGHRVLHSPTGAAGAAEFQVVVWLLVFLIRAYQGLVRPFLIGACKFCPSCSEYGIEALCTHGVLRGSWLTIRRLARCHPFARGGLDPVPPTRD